MRYTITLLLILTSLPLQAGISPLAFGSRGGIPTLAPMLEQVIPAVVSISATMKSAPAPSSPPPAESATITPLQRNQSGLGSGVIIDHLHGVIVTNHHLIEGATKVEVTLNDGRSFDATTIGSDKETDIALLRINATNLRELPLGDSTALRVGDFVIAVGNPFGLGNTATSGIVSALGRSNLGLEQFEAFIQTDASINVGNSGGALVNLNGELVGINTAILAPNGGSVGIGFAIPINMVREINNQLLRHGKVHRGQLGLRAKPLSATLARSLRIAPDQGVVVSEVLPGSSAAQARIEKGDVILSINGHPINTPNQLDNVIGLFPVGKDVKLSLQRGNRRFNLFASIEPTRRNTVKGSTLSSNLEGVILAPLSPLQRNLYSTGGVAVTEVDRRQSGWKLGLRPGDVIFSLNRQPVTNLNMIEEAGTLSDKMVIIRFYRGEKIMEIMMH